MISNALICSSPDNPLRVPSQPFSSCPSSLRTNRKNNPILKAHHPFPSASVCAPVPCCCCCWLGLSVSFVSQNIHGLHNPVAVITEYLLLFMCLFGNVDVIPVKQCMDEKQIKQNKAYLYIVDYSIYCSPIATLIGHCRHEWVFISPELLCFCCCLVDY